MFDNNSIIITNNSNKKQLLKQNKQLINIKIYTLQEFYKPFYFDYNKEAIYYITKAYKIIPEIAQIYLNNLYYIEDKQYKNDKLNFLVTLKKDLISNNLIRVNKLFLDKLKNKKIVIYNLQSTKELDLLISKLKKITMVEIINDASKDDKKNNIYEFNSQEEEIVYVANEICNLVNNNILINNIYLTNLNNDTRKLIKRIFPMFNIPISLVDQDTIYGTFICTKFLELYENDLTNTIEKLKQYITDEKSERVFEIIINTINNYSFIDSKEEVKELIINDLKNTKLPITDIKLSVHEKTIDNPFNENEYVFLLSFNQGIIPTIYKDEDYLTDIDKKELDISLTVDKNNNAKEETIGLLRRIPNLTITYSNNKNGEEALVSNVNESLNYEIIKPQINYNHSNIYNNIKLASLLDEYYKYGTKSELLTILNNTYQNIPYNTYDNKYTGINKTYLQDYLNHKLKLSYSRLNIFYNCPFYFYLNSILKLNKTDQNFANAIGNIFHYVLEKRKEDSDVEELWNEAINISTYEFNIEELFLLKKLKKEIYFIIEQINNQEKFTNLHNELHEQEVNVKINVVPEMPTIFNGKIDKIKYKEYDDQTILSIIDYKTGQTEIKLDLLPYGLSMQLPTYLYLVKHMDRFNNADIAGFYLQIILDKEIKLDGKHTYEELKKKKLLLQGYSNSDIDILKEFDSSYMDSNIIASLKINKNNDFSSNSKILSPKQMEIISDMVEQKIEEGTISISNAEFPISPKVVGSKNACQYCPFIDICFRSNKDINELPPLKIEEVLGGESNELHD